MKNFAYGLVVVSLLWGSSLFAGKKADALIPLSPLHFLTKDDLARHSF